MMIPVTISIIMLVLSVILFRYAIVIRLSLEKVDASIDPDLYCEHVSDENKRIMTYGIIAFILLVASCAILIACYIATYTT